ncbi:uncharacterized protein LOC124699293 [Lolium rigidum]|uniref:uncharacterized protein LOC124699293 n=1 Tax=Lolium rigidum TaxID=89674 RepID=UPI001F5C7B34|nr:uncharacterized protein LOC124699293 [Lolium rigidum]
MSPHPLATVRSPAPKPPPPSYFQSTPVSQDTIQQKELLLHLYAYQHLQGRPNGNQRVIVDPELPGHFGTLAANDWSIYDGPADGPGANLVARAQGLHIGAQMAKESYFICFNMVFVDPRFMGSSFKVMGDFQANEGEWAIVGGTGEFAYAQGVITYKKTQLATGGNMRELHVRALCLSLSKPAETPCSDSSIPDIGPWGKTSGEFLDVPAIPQRLESVTIRHSPHIVSLAFSFTDQAGEKHTVGPWGGQGLPPNVYSKETIELGPSEFVKEIRGTVLPAGPLAVQYTIAAVIASLEIDTNIRTYGPFGLRNAHPFSVPVHGNNSIIGFFARAGKYVEALGVYVGPSVSN